MTIGGSIVLLALGAICSFAIQDSINGVDLVVVGYILMAAGALGVVLSLVLSGQRSSRRDDLPPPR